MCYKSASHGLQDPSLHTVSPDGLQKAASPPVTTPDTHPKGLYTQQRHRRARPPDPILLNAPTKHFIKEDERWWES